MHLPDIDVTKVVLTAVIGSAATSVAGWTWTKVRRKPKPPKPIETAPHEEWPEDVIARSFWARDLHPRFRASAGTRVVILDGDPPVVQMSYPEGEHDVRDAFAAKHVGHNAHAVQHRTGQIGITNLFPGLHTGDPFTDVVCTLEMRSQLEDGDAPSLLRSSLILDDRQITKTKVAAVIENVFAPWIASTTPGLPFAQLDSYFNSRAAEANDLIRQRFDLRKPFVFRFLFSSAEEEEFRKRLAKVLSTAERDLRQAESERALEEWRIEYEKLVKTLEIKKSLVEQLEKITDYDQRIFMLRQNVEELGFFKKQEQEFQREQQDTNFQTARAHALDDVRRKATSSKTGVVELTTPSEHDVRSRDLAPQPQHSNKIMRSGEPLRMRVRSGVSGYVTLLNIGTSGALNVLLPNGMEGNRWVNAGEVLQVPGSGYVITNLAQTPLGPEIIQAFVTPKPLFDPPVQGNFISFPANEMLSRMRQILASLPESGWGEAAITVHVQ